MFSGSLARPVGGRGWVGESNAGGRTVALMALLAAVLLAVGVVAGGTVAATAASTPVSGCGTLSEPGTYHLDANLSREESRDGPCLRIAADGVVLDGRGHAVRDPTASSFHEEDGLLATGANVTVRNVRFEGWDRGLVVRGSGATVAGVESRPLADGVGMGLAGAHDSTVRNVTLRGGGIGLRLAGSNRTTVARSDVVGARNGVLAESLRGGSLHALRITDSEFAGVRTDGVRDLVVANNTVRRSNQAIYLVESAAVVVADNRVADNANSGIELFRTTNATIRDNVAVRSSQAILVYKFSRGARIVDNAVLDSGQAVRLEHSGGALVEGLSVRNSTGAVSMYDLSPTRVDGRRASAVVRDVHARDLSGTGVFALRSDAARLRNVTVRGAGTGFSTTATEDANVVGLDVRDVEWGVSLNYYSDNVTLVDGAIGETSEYGLVASYSTTADSGVHHARNLTLGGRTLSFDVEGVGINATAPPPAGNGTVLGPGLELSTHDYRAWIDLRVRYDDAEVDGLDETTLRLRRHYDGTWRTVGSSPPDAAGDAVRANVTDASIRTEDPDRSPTFALAGRRPLCERTAFEGGTGTPTDPYRIATAGQLQCVREDRDASYELVADVDASATAGWNAGDGFEPVGGVLAPFTGTLDGNGSAIRNLTVDRSTAGVGLFGVTDGAAIEDVRLVDASVAGGTAVGGLVGSATGGSAVRNVSATGTVAGTSAVGGLVGRSRNATVAASYAAASVEGGDRVGGLVGEHGPGATVHTAYATGAVDGERAVGGLVGHSRGTVRETYAAGAVTADAAAGGLVGAAPAGTVASSYWDAASTGQSSSAGLPDAAGLTTAAMTGLTARETMPALAFGSAWLPTRGYPALAWEPGTAAAGVDVRLLPGSTTGVAPGETVSVDVVIDARAQPIHAARIELTYDSGVLDYLAPVSGSFLLQGNTITDVEAGRDEAAGRVTYAETRTGTASGATGNGTLVDVAFEVPADAPEGARTRIELATANLTGPDGATLPVATANATVELAGTARPPVAATGPNRTVVAEANVTLDGTASTDPDGVVVAHEWRQIGGPSVSLRDAGTATPSFVAPAVAGPRTLRFELTATDDAGRSDAAVVAVTVVPANVSTLPGGAGRPTDPDGDGRYEDVSGDGSVNVLDVALLLDGLGSDAVAGNPAFDFSGDGTVNVLDVAELLATI